MFERIANGWQLMKQSARVLQLDKELLLFPVMSGIACLLVMASFATPLVLNPQLLEQAQQDDNASRIILGIGSFLFYLANYLVIIYFNAALVSCAIIRFNGGDPTLRDGLRSANSRLLPILGWALVAATVGLLLRAIENRSERVGRFVAGLVGMAWSAATYFVVPVLVVEKLGPVGAVKRSLAVLRRSWGEALTANFGIGLLSFLGVLIALVPLGLGGYCLASGLQFVGVVLIVLGVLFLLLMSLITSALQTIICGALYEYATEGKVPKQFDEHALKGAFMHR